MVYALKHSQFAYLLFFNITLFNVVSQQMGWWKIFKCPRFLRISPFPRPFQHTYLREKDAIPIYMAATHPRLGTIRKNHIQSNFIFCLKLLFCLLWPDTFPKNYTLQRYITEKFIFHINNRCYRFPYLVKILTSY